MSLQLKALELAEQSLGVHEETPNWGRWVKVYLAFVGLFTPQPWCAAFVVYKVHQAAKALGDKAKLPKYAACQNMFTWAKSRHLLRGYPLVGDIFLQWHPELNRYGHTGFVKSVGRNGSFTTVEGNSNDDGSREGREVCSNKRAQTVIGGRDKFVFFTPQ